MIRPKRTSEWSIAAFLLGFLAITPPLLSIFNSESLVFGIPLLFFYLFCAWAGVIALIVVITKFRDGGDPDQGAADGKSGGGPGGAGR